MMNEIPPKVAPNPHIPLELCREILSRLPVKSLVRFCCVSKLWLSLISDPDFYRLHLKNFKNNRDETHLLVLQDNPDDCVVIRCSDTFQTCASTLPFLIGCRLSSEGSWKIKSCIDGLVLLNITYYRDSGREHQLVLWNPSIRKFHDIPSSPEIETYVDKEEAEIGLGYDPLVKDYKYVKLIRTDPNIPPLVAVYTVGAGSWKIIPFQGNGFSDFVWDFDSIYGQGLCLQGNLYFLAAHQEMNVLELVSYDLSSEVYSSFSLPDDAAYVDESWLAFTELVRYGPSSLALFEYEDSTSMWVWESESMCWTQPYSVDLVMSDFLSLNKNHDILMHGNHKTFTHWCSLVSSYNLETRKEKVLLLEKDNYSWFEVYGYIESLLLLK